MKALHLDAPIIQAGMGGGISRHELCAAVSEAGGLGTICTLDPPVLESEIEAARRLTASPIAVNLLLPFCRRRHFAAASKADVAVTFWGPPRRPASGVWIHQCGSVEEARLAAARGADGLVVQGVEAGGHVRGDEPALELLERCRTALGLDYPLFLAGGIADKADVARALEAGAQAAVLGTRFLLSDESHAHPEYKRRLTQSRETVLTDLFGLGWPRAPHRVVANQATKRWSRSGGEGARLVRAINSVSGPIAKRLPGRLSAGLASTQSPGRPVFSPLPPTDDDPSAPIEAMALYAGQSVARLGTVAPAAELVHALTP